MANTFPQLPCDGEGICMRCKTKPPAEEQLTCSTCVTPWHVYCLSQLPESLESTRSWTCPDCSGEPAPVSNAAGGGGELVAAIRAIEADETLTEKQKAKKRQALLSGGVQGKDEEDEDEDSKKKRKQKGKGKASEEMNILIVMGKKVNCSICMQIPERPVTTPCGHNFCLKCFQKWVRKGSRTCANCRTEIPSQFVDQPRINSALVFAIREAKLARENSEAVTHNVYHFVRNEDKPTTAYVTDKAVKAGKANAASGKIFVTVPPDHFGPIPAENDPDRHRGVRVGDTWDDRMECRQWGAHIPHVAGIAGQSSYGAQSVALSGGYQDDEDHGEWFLYTGSGGRDLSGNKRTNKEQSFDQKFDKMNEALRVSCMMGYPVRVVRSHKEKRSFYAPVAGVRYDGVYRIEKCWRKVGIQKFKVCRYLFVRCDNEPAPWTCDELGDRPRPLPSIGELKDATDIIERNETPSWDFDEEDGRWKWVKPPPPSQKKVAPTNPEDRKRSRKQIRQAHNASIRDKLLREFSCLICREVMAFPVTTPCGHNFCKACLEGAFEDKSLTTERSRGGRTLRAKKNIHKCPTCPTDISLFLQNPQVNRELMEVIETLKAKTEDNVDADDEEDSSEGEDDQVKRTKVDNGDEASDDPEEDGDSTGDSEGVKESKQATETQIKKMENNQVAATEVRVDSPSSTLQIQSSDEDFE